MVRRRRIYISAALIGGFLCLVLVGLTVLVKSEPAFYNDAATPAGQAREILATEASGQFLQIGSAFSDPTWQVTFTAPQLNAYLQEHADELSEEWLAKGFHDPRVRIDNDKLRLGVRYGRGLFSTVVSIDIKVWTVAGESNTIALEIVSLQAGSLPISTGTLLDYIGETVRKQNIDIKWYRHEGHPVAVMRFQADQSRPTFHLENIELKSGALTISGRARELPIGPGRSASK